MRDISSATGVIGYYKQVGGMGYSGAELSGLLYHVDSANGSYSFVFDDVGRVVD